MSKHTAGPWTMVDRSKHGGGYRVRGGTGRYVANTVDNLAGGDEREANAARIAACVNACEGMDDPEAEVYRLRTIEGVLALEDPIPRRLWEIRRSWPISTINFLGRPPALGGER